MADIKRLVSLGRSSEWCRWGVVGEIVGGMILGGSGLFLLLPDLMKKVFFAYPEQGQVLNIFYQLGLIFLMFLSGYNTEININKKDTKTISLVFVGATVIPMLLAIPFIGVFKKAFIGDVNNKLSFSLVFCIGVAITSIPVISKIFFDMGIMNTKFSNTILTVATFQDLCLWILLNIATRVAATGSIDLVQMLIIVFSTLGLFVLITVLHTAAAGLRAAFKVRHKHHVLRIHRGIHRQGVPRKRKGRQSLHLGAGKSGVLVFRAYLLRTGRHSAECYP